MVDTHQTPLRTADLRSWGSLPPECLVSRIDTNLQAGTFRRTHKIRDTHRINSKRSSIDDENGDMDEPISCSFKGMLSITAIARSSGAAVVEHRLPSIDLSVGASGSACRCQLHFPLKPRAAVLWVVTIAVS
jgi:hypothetical protein